MKKTILWGLLLLFNLNIQAQSNFKALLFTKTEAFRHQSIPAGVTAIKELAQQNNFEVTHTENAAIFNEDSLDQFAVAIFLSTTGDILNNNQEEVFEEYMRNGGGFVGIHSATDTEYDWAWYGNLVGTYFDSHPAVQEAVLKINDNTHPATEALPQLWKRTDEWYNFKNPFPGNLNVLISVDESSYNGGNMGENHPVAWYHEFGGGRSFYTALGHTEESYREENFRKHLAGGIMWTAEKGVTSSKDLVTASVKVYPNSASNFITIELPDFEKNKTSLIEICDLKGRNIMQVVPVQKEQQISVSHLPAGFYFVKISSMSGNQVYKITVMK